MKRLLSGGSCLSVMLLGVIMMLTALFMFSVFFSQSQASLPIVTATLNARVSVTRHPTMPVGSPPAAQLTQPFIEMTVQSDFDSTEPTSENPGIAPPTIIALTITPTAPPSLSPALTVFPTLPSLGTLTYPLTLTAEVDLAETHVAFYQEGVAATRTAVASESQVIFATLTARAPTRTAK